MHGCSTRFVLLRFFLAVYLRLVISTPTNYTIDDTFGDSRTGQMIAYQPLNLWATQTCKGCVILPDTSQMMNETYHAATWWWPGPQLSITINFSGTAIFVFFTLVDKPSIFESTITTITAVNFTLDKMSPRNFEYTPQKQQDFLFRSPVFAQNDLVDGNHTLVISGPPSNTNTSIYVNFDYAIYTRNEDLQKLTLESTQLSTQKVSPTPASISVSAVTGADSQIPASSTTFGSITSLSPTAQGLGSTVHHHSNVAVITGATAGVLLFFVAVALLLCCVHRKTKQADPVAFNHRQAHDIGEQTRERPVRDVLHATAVHPVSPAVQSVRPARQEALENRLMTLEQEIQNLTTALSSRETRIPAHQPRLEERTNDPSERVKPIFGGWLDRQEQSRGMEGRLDELPPEYRLEDV